jgi:hypothetical protein
LDEGIYRLEVAKDPGQYPDLYVLLQELEKLALDESWAYFLRWLLLGPLGMNIRNEVADGFVAEGKPGVHRAHPPRRRPADHCRHAAASIGGARGQPRGGPCNRSGGTPSPGPR